MYVVCELETVRDVRSSSVIVVSSSTENSPSGKAFMYMCECVFAVKTRTLTLRREIDQKDLYAGFSDVTIILHRIFTEKSRVSIIPG